VLLLAAAFDDGDAGGGFAGAAADGLRAPRARAAAAVGVGGSPSAAPRAGAAGRVAARRIRLVEYFEPGVFERVFDEAAVGGKLRVVGAGAFAVTVVLALRS